MYIFLERASRKLSSKDFRLAFMEKWFEIEQNGLHRRFSQAILDRNSMPGFSIWLFSVPTRLFSLPRSCCRLVISERVATQIAYILHPQTICYRLSTIGAKKTVPVFLGQRLKNFGNPGQRQQEWGRENSLMEQQNSQIPISGMIFRSKIAKVKNCHATLSVCSALSASFGLGVRADRQGTCQVKNDSLFRASCEGRVSEMFQYLAEGANVNFTHSSENDRTCLISAVHANSRAAVQLLLTNGAEVDLVDGVRDTALHHATRLGHTHLACLLLKRNADFTRVNTENQDVIDLARSLERATLLTVLNCLKLLSGQCSDHSSYLKEMRIGSGQCSDSASGMIIHHITTSIVFQVCTGTGGTHDSHKVVFD
eukprot:sb/3465868/